MWRKLWKKKSRRRRNRSLLLRGTALGLTAAMLLMGCGAGRIGEGGDSSIEAPAGSGTQDGSGDGQQILGRYVESQVDLPEELQYARDLWMDQEGLWMLSEDGSLYSSDDHGQNWQMISQAPAALQKDMEEGTIFYFQ